jgi:carboxyl-terminal processing protease
MFSRKTAPYIALLVVAGLLFAVRSSGIIDPPDKYQKIFQEVTELLEQAHFSPKKIDDVFSRAIFHKYLEELDDDRNIFLAQDIRELKRFETQIDDELHGAPLQFFYAVEQLYLRRLGESSGLYREILAQPFTFSADESVRLEAKDSDWPATPAARKESWRKRLKYMTLDRLSDLMEQREQGRGTPGFVAKTDAELEKEARAKVSSIIEGNFTRLKTRFSEEDRFNLLVNTVASHMDPHTNFMPPLEKRSFDEQMRGSFFGIGASLRGEDGIIKIATLVAGMPAWKSGEVKVGDQVLKVAQGADEPVDVAGFEVEDAVRLIRGKKGTEVRLTLKKADGSVKVVTLIRDEIVLDETYARSAVIQQQGRRIGYIFLPEFYADWENPNGPRSAQDIAREIAKLKEQKVDGIVMDLRNNGGGSLYDVVQIAGYFITDGPIVQVKDRDGNPAVLRDRDRSLLYDGPLAIMVNEFSASASEILAAAMQDYGRGIVVGSSSTYGKGTVQRNIGIDRATSLNGSGNSDLGTVKLTLQKFYRITGGSTQLKGVTPDIVIPDTYEYLKFREKDNPDALPWDEIRTVPFQKQNPGIDYAQVVRSSQSRILANASFKAIRETVNILDRNPAREYSLNLAKYKADLKTIREAMKRVDEMGKTQSPLDISMLPQDTRRLEADKDKLERRKQWVGNLSKDIHLGETVNIVSDMINGLRGSFATTGSLTPR